MNKKFKILLLTSLLFQSFYLTAGWQLPVVDLSDNTQDAQEPQIAIDSGGNAYSVWKWFDGANWIIQTKSYDKVTSVWAAVATNLTATGQNADDPQVAMDSLGNVIVVWERLNAEARRYDNSGGAWSAVENLANVGKDPQIAMNNSGSGIATFWVAGPDNPVYVKKYNLGTGWDPGLTELETESGVASPTPQIAMDVAGNAIAIWRSTRLVAGEIIKASRYVESTDTWLGVENLSEEAQNAYDPQIAMDSAGNAIVVWRRSDGSNDRIQAIRYDVSTGWSAVIDLSVAGENAYEPQVAMDPAGNGIVVWRINSGGFNVIQARKYVFGVGWEASAVNLSKTDQNAILPQVAMGSEGNATAVWVYSDGANTIIQTKSYNVTSNSWDILATDLSAVGEDATNPQIVMLDTENIIVVWQREDSVTGKDVVQSTFFTASLLAPSNLVACKKNHRFPAQTDLMHCLSWNTVEGAASYRVYLDTGIGKLINAQADLFLGILVAESDASTNPCVELHGRCPSLSCTYRVVAVDSKGNEGEVASVTI